MPQDKDIHALEKAIDGLDTVLAVKEGILHQMYELAASQVSLLERIKREEVSRRQADMEIRRLRRQEAELRKLMQKTEATENDLRAILAPLHEDGDGEGWA